jgi:hypothetical protein
LVFEEVLLEVGIIRVFQRLSKLQLMWIDREMAVSQLAFAEVGDQVALP